MKISFLKQGAKRKAEDHKINFNIKKMPLI